jgi:predicted alpha/beta hydrolase
MLRPQAERFARAGYFVLAFDYRGWGESDSRWVRAIEWMDLHLKGAR